MIIGFHNHFYPPEFIAAIRKGPSNFTVTDDDDGNPVLHSPGDYNVVVPGHRTEVFRGETGYHILEVVAVEKKEPGDVERRAEMAEFLLAGTDWE